MNSEIDQIFSQNKCDSQIDWLKKNHDFFSGRTLVILKYQIF